LILPNNSSSPPLQPERRVSAKMEPAEGISATDAQQRLARGAPHLKGQFHVGGCSLARAQRQSHTTSNQELMQSLDSVTAVGSGPLQCEIRISVQAPAVLSKRLP
jgi:hypothetical protein